MKRLHKSNSPGSVPRFCDFNFDGIPDELKKLARWVNWREVVRDGKPTKVPINPASGQFALCTDPSTWATYDQAVERFKRDGVDGIGFQLGSDYVGIDLDECRNRKNGQIQLWAQEIIQSLASYTEISPSGDGVHVWVEGTLPKVGRRKGHIEMYDTGRYFTVTGLHLDGTPRTIEARASALTSLHQRTFCERKTKGKAASEIGKADIAKADAELIERARSAKNGSRFARLWTGDFSGYDSHSEADLALCMILAFWAGQDAKHID